MDLKEEIKKKKVMAKIGSDGDYDIEPMLYLQDAIEIAEKYAEEMCKKQNQINYENLLSEIREQLSSSGRVNNKFLYKVQIDQYFENPKLATDFK